MLTGHQHVDRVHGKALRWWHGWFAIVALPAAVIVFVPATAPRWLVMWALAFAIYSGCKWLTCDREEQCRSSPPSSGRPRND
jgi:hypothetical protein